MSFLSLANIFVFSIDLPVDIFFHQDTAVEKGTAAEEDTEWAGSRFWDGEGRVYGVVEAVKEAMQRGQSDGGEGYHHMSRGT